MSAINKINSSTIIDGETITDLIARKDCHALKIKILQHVIHEASGSFARHDRSEIKIVRTVNVTKPQKQADSLSKELRLLDNTLQQANWKTEPEQ